MNFYEPIKRQRLVTFASMKKTVEVKTNSKVVQSSPQSDIYGKISLMQQSRKVDLKDAFCCPIDPLTTRRSDENK